MGYCCLRCDCRSVCYCPKRITPSVTIYIDGGQPIIVTDDIQREQQNKAYVDLYGLFSTKPEQVTFDLYLNNVEQEYVYAGAALVLNFENTETGLPVDAYDTLDDVIESNHYRLTASLNNIGRQENVSEVSTMIESIRVEFGFLFGTDANYTSFGLFQTV